MSARERRLYASPVPTRRAAMFAGVLCLACLGTATPVRADASALPGGPSSRTGVFAIGPETGLVIPASTKRLCPAGTQCIADLGWSVGVAFSYRWAKGIGLGVAYDEVLHIPMIVKWPQAARCSRRLAATQAGPPRARRSR